MKLLYFFTLLIISNDCFSKEYYKKNMVDRAHESFSKSILILSNNIDEFFADAKHERIKNKSKLKISMDTRFREGRGPYIVPEINYKLVLPKTERQLQLFIQNEDEDKKSETSQAKLESTQGSAQDEENNITAGLRHIVKKSGIVFSTDTGIIVNIPMVVFARFTAKKSIEFTNWILKVNEQVKWVNDQGFTSNLDLDFDKRLSRRHVLRMVNNTFWNDQDYVIRLENGPSLFHKINRKIAMSYHAHIISINKPSFVIDNYLLQVTYRQLIYRKWLYMGLSPFVNFPRAQNFHRTPGFVLSFDAVFGYL